MKKIREFLNKYPTCYDAVRIPLTTHEFLNGGDYSRILAGMKLGYSDDKIMNDLELTQREYDNACKRINELVSDYLGREMRGEKSITLGMIYRERLGNWNSMDSIPKETSNGNIVVKRRRFPDEVIGETEYICHGLSIKNGKICFINEKGRTLTIPKEEYESIISWAYESETPNWDKMEFSGRIIA